MDTRVNPKKLGLKERYAAMTRGLGWEPSYQPRDKVFPFDKYEGIRIHDWNAFSDPFRLTVDAYWKYQGEKEKKLYAVIEAFAQNSGQLGITDARYVNALKLFIQGVTPLEYYAHRGFAHLARQFGGDGLRLACLYQSADELRHQQTETHAMSVYNKYFNGMHESNHWFDRVWYLSVPKSFFEDALTAGPFEFLTAVSFSFEYVLTNLLFVPFMSGAAHNGELQALAHERLTSTVVLSAPTEPSAWSDATGFVHTEVERALAPGLGRFDFYFAGPPPMIDAMQDLLMVRHRVPFEQIRFDRYV